MGFETPTFLTLYYPQNYFEAVPMGFETLPCFCMTSDVCDFEAVPMGFETKFVRSEK